MEASTREGKGRGQAEREKGEVVRRVTSIGVRIEKRFWTVGFVFMSLFDKESCMYRLPPAYNVGLILVDSGSCLSTLLSGLTRLKVRIGVAFFLLAVVIVQGHVEL